MAADPLGYARGDARTMQERGRGICQPEVHDMEPCEVCGTFIEAGSHCDHHNAATVRVLLPPSATE